MSFQRSFAVMCCVILPMGRNAPAADRPNILLIMADDIGIEGLGCYGGMSYQTPNLDKLAAEGMRFTHAYAQPLCTPTRVQIMTGRYNHRNWKYFGILDPKEKTFGHHLQSAGYKTGIFGKWQLQSYDPPNLPNSAERRGTGMHAKDAGFDEYALFHALHTEDKGSRFANPRMLEGVAGSPGEIKDYPAKYGEDIWVDKVVDFFDRHRTEPTFVYYPMALPHHPWEPTPHSPGWDPQNIPEQDVRYIKDMVEYMDFTVGSLLGKLTEKGLRENTLVLFYADNGFHNAVRSDVADGRSIAGGKAKTLQTAIHVPLIAHWPGHIAAGTSNNIVDASDFVPTLMELTSAKPSDAVASDGISFAPQLLNLPISRQGHSSKRPTGAFPSDSSHRLAGRPARPAREVAFFWYDPRPGWDKERFRRSVFAVNHDYKLFRNGRLYRLTDNPLEEIAVDPLKMSPADSAAQQKLSGVIDKLIEDSDEPPLVDAYGRPEADLLHFPSDRDASDRICDEIQATAEEHVYGDPDIAAHRLWIYKPLDAASDEFRPTVFFIHGGSWGGHPRMLAAQSAWLQRRGFTVVNIHFRMPRGNLTPHDTLRDVRKAYRWVIQHGKMHNIDIDRLVVSGGSAGGHLSLAMCTIALPDDPIVEHQPRGLVLFNPVIDLVDGWSGGRKKCEAAGIDARSFSPAHHVTADLPPVLVLSGSNDGLITPVQIKAFQARMQSAGNRCEFIEYPGAGHGFFNYGRERNKYFQWTMWAFEDFVGSPDGRGRGVLD